MVCVYFFKTLIFSCLNLFLSIEDRRLIIGVFCEYYLSKSDALRREQYFKTTPGKRVLSLMLQESLMLVAAVKKRPSF
jgi:putative endonuclease